MTDRMSQITVEYSPVEDRVLLRINTVAKVELRLWLTRKIVRELWAALFGVIEGNPEIRPELPSRVKKAVMSLQHQEAVQSGNFAAKHDKETTSHPLTEEPPLVIGVACGPWKNGSAKLSLHTKIGKKMNLNLDENMVHALCHLLVSATTRAGWGLDLMIGEPTGFAVAADHQVH